MIEIQKTNEFGAKVTRISGTFEVRRDGYLITLPKEHRPKGVRR